MLKPSAYPQKKNRLSPYFTKATVSLPAALCTTGELIRVDVITGLARPQAPSRFYFHLGGCHCRRQLLSCALSISVLAAP